MKILHDTKVIMQIALFVGVVLFPVTLHAQKPNPVYPAFVNPAIRSEFRKYMPLNDGWHFRVDPRERGSREGWAKGGEEFGIPIRVPGGVWALKELADEYPSFNQPNSYEGTCWYQRRFELGNEWSEGKLWLKFGGVTPTAHVWLNGQYLGYHNYPNVGFKFDGTEAAVYGGMNVLTLELVWRDLGMRGGLNNCGPGIYCGVELERTGDVRIEDLFIRPRIDESEAWVSAVLYNDTPKAQKVRLRTRVRPHGTDEVEKETLGNMVRLEPNSSESVLIKVDMNNHKLWTPDTPFLYVLTLEVLSKNEVVDAVAERFGMRHMTVENKQLVLNHVPLMWRAVSPEFKNCPTITPLVDKEIIRRVIMAMKNMGFNGKRYHTHVPTREELDICDELGFLIQVEPSVISNFNEIRPYPENRATWTNKIKEVRNHPSVVVFSMGNENSQIMHLRENQVQAKVHWADARKLVPDHLLLTGTGYQGEYPEVQNDFQTPHLWSQAWKWAYEGLSAVPWNALEQLADKGPLIIHEYGKMTIWPDPAEDELFRKSGMPLRGNYGERGLVALKEAGIDHLLPKVVLNSRNLSAVCTKIVVEQARRQPGVFGYQYHCALRVGANRGFIDDLGFHTDPQFADFPLSNGNTALLIDRDFRHRTLTEGEPVSINIHLSHFGEKPITDATLIWSLKDGDDIIQTGRVKGLNFSRGKNGFLQQLQFIAPKGLGKFTLHVNLKSGGRELTRNNWDLWRFPHPNCSSPKNILITASDTRWEYDMMAKFPNIRRMNDFKSAYLGLRQSEDSAKYAILTSGLIKGIISDQWNEDLAGFVKSGGTVMLFDRGSLPKDWYAPVSKRDGDYDIFKLYAPFRTGWDHGNAATIVYDNPMLGDFPNEGWCDLHCFEMIEGAATLKTAMLPGAPNPVIRVIPMWRLEGDQVGPAPENSDVAMTKASEDRYYLAGSQLGKGRLVVCSLRLLAEPAGRYLLERLVENIDSNQIKLPKK